MIASLHHHEDRYITGDRADAYSVKALERELLFGSLSSVRVKINIARDRDLARSCWLHGYSTASKSLATAAIVLILCTGLLGLLTGIFFGHYLGSHDDNTPRTVRAESPEN